MGLTYSSFVPITADCISMVLTTSSIGGHRRVVFRVGGVTKENFKSAAAISVVSEMIRLTRQRPS